MKNNRDTPFSSKNNKKLVKSYNDDSLKSNIRKLSDCSKNAKKEPNLKDMITFTKKNNIACVNSKSLEIENKLKVPLFQNKLKGIEYFTDNEKSVQKDL